MVQVFKMKKIFITGGAGYVGSALVPKLIEKGYHVTVYDLMIYGEDVIEKNKNLRMIKSDIRDQKLLEESLTGQDVVIHLACISNDPSFELNPSLGKSINLESF
jgi:nucleoside-diphosphate-sugar epimerase